MISEAYTNIIQSSVLHVAFFYRRGDIARALIARKADIDQVNAFGSTVVNHLFQPEPVQQGTSTIEFIEILLSCSFSGFKSLTWLGYSSLHRAAAYGTAEDVERLIRCGTPLNVETNVEKWSPIFFAVAHGNIHTFQQLATHYNGDHVKHIDNKGRTLLHLAASTGNSELIQMLIAHGSDPHARSYPIIETAPQSSWDMPGTPTDVAECAGPSALEAYIQGVRNGGVDIDQRTDDIFWPTEEAHSTSLADP